MSDLSDDDRALINRAKEEALAYVSSFGWCPNVESIAYVNGIPGVVHVFMVSFREPVLGTADDRLWLVVGDLPSAYLVVEDGDNVRDVLHEYCNLMEDWVLAVRAKSDLKDVFPVRADQTEEMALMLKNRVRLLRDDVIGNLVEGGDREG